MSDKKQNLKNSLANFIKQAREQKVVSYEEINSVLSIGFSTEKIEQLIKKLTDDGVQIVDTIKEKEDLLKVPDSIEAIEKMEISDFEDSHDEFVESEIDDSEVDKLLQTDLLKMKNVNKIEEIKKLYDEFILIRRLGYV